MESKMVQLRWSSDIGESLKHRNVQGEPGEPGEPAVPDLHIRKPQNEDCGMAWILTLSTRAVGSPLSLLRNDRIAESHTAP